MDEFELSITVPVWSKPKAVLNLLKGKSTYTFKLTHDEMQSLARNSLGAFSPKVEAITRPTL